jgi:hypothetical protein
MIASFVLGMESCVGVVVSVCGSDMGRVVEDGRTEEKEEGEGEVNRNELYTDDW